MGTVFKINTSKKKKPQNTKPVEKTSTIINFSSKPVAKKTSYLTYLVGDEEKVWTGKYSKTIDGSYVYEHTGFTRIPLEVSYSYNYKVVDSHFAYLDNDGKERVCNILNSIEFDEENNTYTGEVNIVEHEDREVEIYPMEEK